TPNNGGALDPDHGNRELDFPVLTSAAVSAGTTTVIGTACTGCTVEIYEAVGGTGDDDPPGSGSNYHGEGDTYLGSGVATGGSFSIDVTGVVAGDDVSATATDTVLGVTSEFALNETVVVGNDPPTFDQDLGNRTEGEGQSVSLSASATDPDGDPLTYSATGLPPGLSINTSTGLITGTIDPGSEGAYAVTITVDDLISGTDVDTFTWTITKGLALISDIPATSNDLLSWFNPDDPSPVTNEADIGTGTGTTVIEGMDAEPGTGTLYAAAGTLLGTINGVTGVWNGIGAFGSADGAVGTILVDDIAALAFDPISGVLYGVHDRGVSDEDILVQINPLSGSVVADGFGVGVDYVLITGQASRKTVESIAVDPTTGIMYGQIRDGLSTNTRLVTIDTADGTTSNKGGLDPHDAKGLAFLASGQLIAVGFEKNSPATQIVFDIDKTNSNVSNIRVVDNGENYQAIATPLPLTAGIYGAVFEDLAGDTLAGGLEIVGDANNPMRAGVTVRLYRDDGSAPGDPDATDSLVGSTTTDGLGQYSFQGIPDGDYWVAVDSTTVSPSAGINTPTYSQAGVWAEQTYGSDGSVMFDGVSTYTYTAAGGPFYGGKQETVSDAAATLPGAEHVVSVSLAGIANVNNDFGFSFNAVTNVEATTAAVVDGRSAQGSFDQFIRNANAVTGPNALRFVPAVPQNDGTGSWWRIDYAAAGNPLQDIFDAGTVVDGTAFDAADGTTVVDSNGGFLGANAAGGVSVGTAPTALPQVAKPELEIKDEGLRLSQVQAPLLPHSTEIRNLSVWGDATSVYALTGASSLTGLVFDGNVIGTPPGAFVDPATVGASYGLRVSRATGTQVTDNLIGFVDYTPLLLETSTSGATVSGNEIRGGGRTQAAWDGVLLWGTGDTIDGNLIADNGAMGIDLNAAAGGHTIENNTVQNSGLLGTQTAGLRIKNHDNTVRFNVFQNNAGPGISVEGGAAAALRNLLSQNEYNTNGGLSIDLALVALADDLGDGVNPNDAVTDVTHGNEGLDHPLITAAAPTSVSGTACANCTIEVYRAVAGAGDTSGGIDYGEGVAFVGSTVADAGGDWTAAVGGLVVDDAVSAIAIDTTNNTSEFGPNVIVNGPPVLDPVGDKSIDELALLSFTATAADPNGGDTLSFSLSGEPTGASITAGGAFTWIPAESQGPGDYTFDVVVTDDGAPNLADSETITVTVNEVNTPPSVTNPGNQTNDEGDVVFLAIAASDVDLPANVLTYSATGLPLGLSINEVTGAIMGTISYTAAGTYNVEVTVTDNGTPAPLATMVPFTWTINDILIPGIPLGITKVSDGGGSVLVGETIEYTITVTNTDIEKQTNFTVTDSVPAGTTYVPGSTTVDYPSSVNHTYRDELTAQTYSGTNGTEDWSTSPWVEIGEADGPLAGAWQVVDDTPPAAGPFGLYKTGAKNVGIARPVDLDPALYADAFLTFSYRRSGMIPANTILVQVSTNGLAGPWTNLFIIDGGPGGVTDPAYLDSPVIDLSNYRSPSTAIRFYHTGANDFDVGRFIIFDDIEVTAIERVPASAAGGAPSTLATGYDLYPGESITVTWQVTVDTPAGVSQVENTASVVTDQETSPASAGPVVDVVANRDPVAADDGPGVGFSTFEDVVSYTTGNVLANDSDPDSDPITVGSFDATSTGGGTVSYNGDGTFDFSPAADWNGNDTFTYTLDDGRSGSATATVTIEVVAVNDEPSFTAGGNVAVAEDSGPYSAAWASGISKGPADESSQTVTFNVTGNTNPGLFSAAPVVSSGGVLTFTPADQANGSADITIELQDSGGIANGGDDTSPAVVFTITVSAVNDPPVLDAVGDQSIDELVNLSFTATASDPSDVPPNTLVFSLSGAPAGASITAGGDFSWTPTEAQGPGSYTFDVVVTETNGSPTNLSDSETITVTVGEVNLAPILDAVGDKSIDELVNLSFTATASDPDDPANLLTFSLVGAPVGASITGAGDFSWTPTEAQGPGSYTFDVVVTETNGSPTNLSDSETITVTVNEVNLPPILDAVGDQSIDELVNLTFTATASDPDDPANLLTFSLVGAPVGATITGAGDFSWTPTEAQGPGSYTFDVVVTETNGSPTNLSDSETITVSVGEVNLPPVLDAVGDKSTDELVNLSFTATASDPDDPANLLTFSLSGAPVGATITGAGDFSWAPTEAQGPGSYTFDVVVTETNGSPTNLSDSETITVSVGEVNLPPVLDAVGDKST
ncbi:MAG: Ig-like domain-containing protein, partial [Acidimicrobiia bacterium]|nr:Ig-like domain-containing protein [Acidimicrobiia bacterium]